MRLTTTWLAVACFALAGCTSETKGSEADHDHDLAPAHGGVLLELDDHGPALETVYSESAGKLTIYVRHPHADETLTVEKPPILKLEEGAGSVTAKGAGTEWEFVADALKKHVHGAIQIEINGKTYNKDWHPSH